MAATAAKPPSGATSPTALKTSATWNPSADPAPATAATATAAARPPALSRSSTTPPNLRRPGRQPPSDYLSDKPTAAFIRRTLCAQHLADRGRNSPLPIEQLLPPLTTRNDLDLQLYALLAVILREYVQNWYNKITPDETFVAEIVQIIAHCTRALEQRIRKVDLESLLFDELPELLDEHVRAYRTAKASAARPPIETNHREIYHSLCPLPALSPVPKPNDARSVQIQAGNEAAYRQLLVQGVLALLLPTEDLENDCLTSLVGQIFSELIIGNLVANKLSEPWMLLEIFIILTRLAKRDPQPPGPQAAKSDRPGPHHDQESLKESPRRGPGWSITQLFWSFVQWGFLLVNAIRLIAGTIALSRSLPPRVTPLQGQELKLSKTTGHSDSEKPSKTAARVQTPTRVPIIDFKLWSCVANLLEVDARMPWLGGALSMMQWGAMRGPGNIAGYDAAFDRLLSHYIQSRLLDPALLTPLLRSIRATLYPNNAPGVSSLAPPSSYDELVALRRRCASAIWALVPKSVGRLYFGSVSFWPGPRRSSPNTAASEAEKDVNSSSSSSSDSRSGPLNSGGSSAGTAPSTYNDAYKAQPRAGGSKDTQEGGTVRLTEGGKPSGEGTTQSGSERGAAATTTTRGSTPAAEGRSAATAQEALLALSPLEGPPSDPNDDDRILSEIESGILDLFSDPYCNKHLLYGALELILVRLMPELAEQGIIELWEERLN